MELASGGGGRRLTLQCHAGVYEKGNKREKLVKVLTYKGSYVIKIIGANRANTVMKSMVFLRKIDFR